MSGNPSLLAPWYVVMKAGPLYFSTVDETNPFTKHKEKALLFMSLHSAHRVAEAEEAMIRVLVTDKHLKEFGR